MIFSNQLTLKSISRGYAQHKQFSQFNWTATGGIKIDQSIKMGQQKLIYIYTYIYIYIYIYIHIYIYIYIYIYTVITKTANHPKPSETMRSKPTRSETIRPETIRNHLKPSPLTQDYPPHPSPPATSSKLHKPVRHSSYSCKQTQILSKLP